MDDAEELRLWPFSCPGERECTFSGVAGRYWYGARDIASRAMSKRGVIRLTMLALCIIGGRLQGLVYSEKVGKWKANTKRLVHRGPEGVSSETSLLRERKEREDVKRYLFSTNTTHCYSRYETQQESAVISFG